MATTTTTRRLVTITAATVLTLGAVACGGGDSAGGTGEVSATLAIISTNIETDRDARGFEAATEGETLTPGDQVRTDPTGFAELTYHDGSWQRIENSATLTIDELTNAGDTNTVRTSVDVGDTWNRVETLTEPDDTYELDTPVATAAVRGTAFATQCPTPDECTFSVIEGTVEITPDTGQPVTLTAGQQITITTDTPPPAPETPGIDTLRQDPFIAKNLDLDTDKAAGTPDDGGTGDDTEGATGDDLDPDSVNPCVLDPAEVELLHDLNPDPLGGFAGATFGPGVVDEQSGGYPTCGYEMFLPEDEDWMPASYFFLGVDTRSGTTCFVEHRGLCVFPVTTYGDAEPATYVVPESITTSVKARLDAQ